MSIQSFTRWVFFLLTILCLNIFWFHSKLPAERALAAPTDLLFSEYIEGSGDNKALEIFNGSNSAVDLLAGGYDVQFFFNGSLTPTLTITLTGVIPSGDVYVLADNDADAAILAQADQLSTEPFFNGNDVVALRKAGALLDIIGQIGLDPGVEWGTGLTSTAENTLRRKISIQTGDSNGGDAFDPVIEWDGLAPDTFTNLGLYALPLPALSVVINEVAWAGTVASANDEWIELFNPGSQPIDLNNWILRGNDDGQPVEINLTGTIAAGGYWLLERQDDNTIADIGADQIYSFSNGLVNDGETLQLIGPSGAIIDSVNEDGGDWPGGAARPAYISLERINPTLPDAVDNWQSNDMLTRNGQDADSNPINGTPKQPNSRGAPPPPPPAPPLPLTVVINEVGWSGTAANAADEWLELYNTTPQTITLDGWVITSSNGLEISLDETTIGPQTYYLIERTDDDTISDISANVTTSFGRGLRNDGDVLFLSAYGVIVDTANYDGGVWPVGTSGPDFFSMERLYPAQPDTEDNWISNDGQTRNGLDALGNPINGSPGQKNRTKRPPSTPLPTPTPIPSSTPAPIPATLLISEFLYDGLTPSTEGDEFVEICNPNPTTVDLTGYKIGDEEIAGEGESMYLLPAGIILESDACLVIAKTAVDFQSRFGSLPDLVVTDLVKYTAWGSGKWSLANDGDELLLLGPNDQIIDSVAYRNGDYALLGLELEATAPEPDSLQRVWPIDTDSMPHDFVRDTPTPGFLTVPPAPPAEPPPPAFLPDGMQAYWGHLHAHTSYSDGAGPPHYALALARAAGLHFYGISDHGWWLSEWEWTRTLTQTEAATVPGQFIALRGVEWTHDTAGHINIFNTNTLINRTHPMFDDLSDFYTWLATNPDVVAQFNHPDPRYGGDFNQFALHPAAAQRVVLQEIGNNARQYTTYEPSFIQSNSLGWKTAPVINGDTHTVQWGVDTPARTGIVVPALTQDELLAALRARRVFATEDSNLAITLRLNGAWMGMTLPTGGMMLPLIVDLADPDSEPVTLQIYDRNLLLATAPLTGSTGQWQTTVAALPGHYYWVRAIQADGDKAYTAPIWIGGQAPADKVYINELLPSPQDVDWDGDGSSDHHDEWIEMYNPANYPIGLGGWQLREASGSSYKLPLDLIIPPRGFVTVYKAQTTFALNNGGDAVTLTRPDGTIVDSIQYDHTPGYDETWCRLPDGEAHWSHDCGPSPNAPNWELERKSAGPLEVKIFEARRLAHNAWVRVTGRVTVPPGVLGDRYMYIQDNSSGILIYLSKEHRLFFNLGDEVRIEGNVRSFHEETEIAVSEREDVDFIKPGPPLPPLPIETTNMLEPYEGMLVMLQGPAVRFAGQSTFWVDDGTDPAKIVVRRSTGIKKPFIKPGTPVTVVGVVSQYSDPAEPTRYDYRLLPRYQFDLVLPEPVSAPTVPSQPENWPIFLPETGER